MKKIVLYCVTMLSAIIGCNAQVTLDVKNSAGQMVILPSMQNLVKLVNCNAENFKATMSAYHYFPDKDYVGKDICYNNWSLKLWMNGNDGRGANTYIFDAYKKLLICRIPIKCMWPTGYIGDWNASMRKYYTKTDDDIDMFVYEVDDAYYGIMLQINRQAELVLISIRKYSKE